MSILIYHLLIIFITTVNCQLQLTRISSKPANIIFKYRHGATGESTLDECRSNEVCNVVYQRFWMSNLAERLCRCPNGDECPWSEKADNHSIVLNNRSLLKFCQSINDKNICKPKQNAVTVNGEINQDYTSINFKSVSVNCICPSTHYWKLKKYDYIDNRVYQLYRCSQQRMCDSYDFCGFVRADIFSIYYRCSCPESNLCITKDKKKEIVQELMYMGMAFRAYCDPWNISSRYY